MSDDGDWHKQLLIGVGMLAAVALLVGGILGGAALVAADFAGLGAPRDDSESGITLPDRTRSPGTGSPSARPGTQSPDTPTPRRPRTPILLTAAPAVAGTFDRVTLQGRFRNRSAAAVTSTLQVQRRDGSAWSDFPVTTDVEDGAFSTYIQTGRTGKNRFRVVDPVTGRASNSVVVTIR